MSWNNIVDEDKERYKQRMRKRGATLYCPFEDCRGHENTGKGNIVFIRKYGKGGTQNLFKCRTCGRTFSERRGTPLFNCKLKEDRVYQIVKCLAKGQGVRATARIVGVNKDTVGLVIERFGENIENVAGCLITEEWDDEKAKKFLMKMGHSGKKVKFI